MTGHGGPTMSVTVHQGDCLEVMRSLPDASVDSVVTDPPYGLEFMGKDWDAPWRQASGSWADRDPAEHARPESRGQTASPFLAAKVNKFAAGLPFQQWCELWATECLRVLKPGGHLLAFGGTRTWHRLVVAVEDAGFEIRDSIAWLYGSGFPKSLDVSKAIDKMNGRDMPTRYALARHIREVRESAGFTRADVAAWFPQYREVTANWERCDEHGNRVPTPSDWDVLRERLGLSDDWLPLIQRVEAEREAIGKGSAGLGKGARGAAHEGGYGAEYDVTAPATPDAARWQGWGTALKPSFEPIVVARKPLSGTVASNVLAHGTGAMNVDACRVDMGAEYDAARVQRQSAATAGMNGLGQSGYSATHEQATYNAKGRWPTNVVLDGHTADALDEQSGYQRDGVAVRRNVGKSGGNFPFGRANPDMREDVSYGSGGGASRFFPTFRYQAKAPARERPRYKREGGSDNATTYGQMKTRECNVCGSRAKAAGGEHSGKPWPSCGHDDWSWVEQQSARDEFVAHPTVKPLELMRWLVRLVTPPGGVVLDPFAGSGATVEAALLEGFACIAIEREADYLPLIHVRIDRQQQPGQGAARGSCA